MTSSEDDLQQAVFKLFKIVTDYNLEMSVEKKNDGSQGKNELRQCIPEDK